MDDFHCQIAEEATSEVEKKMLRLLKKWKKPSAKSDFGQR
jgi:hypothetical protein